MSNCPGSTVVLTATHCCNSRCLPCTGQTRQSSFVRMSIQDVRVSNAEADNSQQTFDVLHGSNDTQDLPCIHDFRNLVSQ